MIINKCRSSYKNIFKIIQLQVLRVVKKIFFEMILVNPKNLWQVEVLKNIFGCFLLLKDYLFTNLITIFLSYIKQSMHACIFAFKFIEGKISLLYLAVSKSINSFDQIAIVKNHAIEYLSISKQFILNQRKRKYKIFCCFEFMIFQCDQFELIAQFQFYQRLLQQLLIPLDQFLSLIELDDIFYKDNDRFFTKYRLFLLVDEYFFGSSSQIKKRKKWRMVSLFEAKMYKFLLVDLSLHPKYCDLRMKLSFLEQFVQHFNMLFTFFKAKYRIKDCYEDVSIERKLLICFICLLGKLYDLLEIQNRENVGNLLCCCWRKTFFASFPIYYAISSITLQNLVVNQLFFKFLR